MPINLSAIANSLQSLHVPKPDMIGRMHTLADLQNTQRQGQMDDLKIQEQQRQAAQGQALHDALVKSGGDIESALPDIAKAAPELYPHYKQIVDSEKQQAMTQEANARKTAVENYTLQNGKIDAPEQQVGAPGMAAPPSVAPENGVVPIQAPIAQGFTQELPVPNAQIPGANGQPGFSLPVTAAQQAKRNLFQQAKAKLQDEITLNREKQKAEKDFSTVNQPAPPAAPRTTTTAQGVMQWNPATSRYDIKVGDRPPSASAATTASGASDAKETARGIMEGLISPNISQSVSYKDRSAVSAELTRNGFNQAEALRDWQAINKHIATLNGAQQERLRQAITFTSDTLPQLEDAYKEWKKQAGVSGYKILNRANLATMKQLSGAPGSAATNLEALISDFTSELGTVYKGGNGSTDESLKLAARNLSGEWNEQTFNDAISRLKKSLLIRKNSINTSEAQGVSPASPYQPQGQTNRPAAPAAPTGGFRIIP